MVFLCDGFFHKKKCELLLFDIKCGDWYIFLLYCIVVSLRFNWTYLKNIKKKQNPPRVVDSVNGDCHLIYMWIEFAIGLKKCVDWKFRYAKKLCKFKSQNIQIYHNLLLLFALDIISCYCCCCSLFCIVCMRCSQNHHCVLNWK